MKKVWNFFMSLKIFFTIKNFFELFFIYFLFIYFFDCPSEPHFLLLVYTEKYHSMWIKHVISTIRRTIAIHCDILKVTELCQFSFKTDLLAPFGISEEFSVYADRFGLFGRSLAFLMPGTWS